MKKIIMTGGGTSGHVTPNIALIQSLKDEGFDIQYIGSENGIEKKLIEAEGLPFHSISSGKLRRYFDMKNFTDAFRVIKGFGDALNLVRKLKPDVVFSKGGFVTTPVVWAARMCRIPVVIHESDYTPGLANKLSLPFASKICYTFPETAKYLPQKKRALTGIPVRSTLLNGSRHKGLQLCGFDDSKPMIMVIGGSLGSRKINELIRNSLNILLEDFQICHICGKDGTDNSLLNQKGYKQFEYVNAEQPHIFAAADIVVSRAGATTLFEVLALKKPNLLIPLSEKVSRGDQVLNAKSFEKRGFSIVLQEESITADILVDSIKTTYNDRQKLITAMNNIDQKSGVEEVIKVIKGISKSR